MGFVCDLEDYLIEPDQWNQDQSWRQVVPADLLQELEGPPQPIGLGRHPDLGWFVMYAGQGPFLAWSEKEK